MPNTLDCFVQFVLTLMSMCEIEISKQKTVIDARMMKFSCFDGIKPVIRFY